MARLLRNNVKYLFTVALLSVLLHVPALAGDMTLTSTSFQGGGRLANSYIFNGFGCEGGNLSPALSWSGAPEGTKSYIVTAYDPDAPTGSGWWHWTVFNIPASVTSLTEGGPPPEGAIEGRTDFGTNTYGGPCPPEGHGVHHYIFTVYAMPEETLPLDANASGAMVGFFANTQALAKAQITGLYSR